jgi:predicted lipid-binding transport protein (Tim44 family)
MTTNNRLRRRALLPGLGLLLTLLFLIAACSGAEPSSDVGVASSESAGGSDAQSRDSVGAAPAPAAPEVANDFATRSAGGKAAPAPGADIPLQTRAVISTGTVTLQSKDVEQARFDVQKVVDGHGGEISDEQTATDDKGVIDRSRLVIRVPSDSFGDVMDELGDVADLRSAKRTSEDVTTEVIDIGVRVRAQEKSLERIELLLGRAQNLRAIIAIESQLTRRQAELDSLKAQQAYLADQTSLSTITVFLEQKKEKAQPVEKDEAGFLAGLESGWTALGGAATVLATGLGAVLPFAILMLLLGVPTWLLARSVVRRRRSEPLAAE